MLSLQNQFLKYNKERVMQKDQLVRVKDNHKFHAGRLGRFEFMGGIERDIVVLSDLDNSRSLFAVGQNDVEIVDEANSEIHYG